MRTIRHIIELAIFIAFPVMMAGDATGKTDTHSANKVLSVDYCADQYVLALADRDQIQAVSKNALDAHSFYSDRAQGIPGINGSAETVLMLGPDLVVRSWQGSVKTDVLFERTGSKVSQVGFPTTPEDVFAGVLRIAKAMELEDAGKALVANQKARFEKLRSYQKEELKAVYITPGGFTAGIGTFVDDVIKLAGFQTVADDMVLRGWNPIPLEALILDPPDIIIGSFFDLTTDNRSEWGITRHPILNRMMEEIPTIIVPSKYLSCNGFFFVDGAEYIRGEAEKRGLFKKSMPEKQERVK